MSTRHHYSSKHNKELGTKLDQIAEREEREEWREAALVERVANENLAPIDSDDQGASD